MVEADICPEFSNIAQVWINMRLYLLTYYDIYYHMRN